MIKKAPHKEALFLSSQSNGFASFKFIDHIAIDPRLIDKSPLNIQHQFTGNNIISEPHKPTKMIIRPKLRVLSPATKFQRHLRIFHTHIREEIHNPVAHKRTNLPLLKSYIPTVIVGARYTIKS